MVYNGKLITADFGDTYYPYVSQDAADGYIANNTPFETVWDDAETRQLNLLNEDGTPITQAQIIDKLDVPNFDDWYINTELRFIVNPNA